jgi:copper homeostasis protein
VRRLLLEVIVCSVDDALAAAEGGAGRLEIVRDLQLGGLTPDLATVRDIVSAVRIPVRAMVRETQVFEVTDAAQVERLFDAAAAFADAGVEGLVLGFLRNGMPDLNLTSSVIAAASLPATFHRAFDEVLDPFVALDSLKTCVGVDRVLTSAGGGSWSDRAKLLARYATRAAPEIAVLPGGEVDESALRELVRVDGVAEAHAGRAARRPPTHGGRVDAERVRALARAATE